MTAMRNITGLSTRRSAIVVCNTEMNNLLDPTDFPFIITVSQTRNCIYKMQKHICGLNI